MTKDKNYIRIKNGESIDLSEIIVLDYGIFFYNATDLLRDENKHCLSYYASKKDNDLFFIMAIADDSQNDIIILSHILKSNSKKVLESLTPLIPALHIFEREIFENFGVNFLRHPWLKPVRYAFNRFDKNQQINNYPFYNIKSENLHEISVGPIHAGVIEPGLFRFLCNGENVLHLEIQLGWQHRGIEELMINKKTLLQKNILAENIAGDTAVSHSTAFAMLIESLASFEVSEQLQIERALASELERIAIHTADIAALCVDAAYYLGANVFGILRTGIINFIQSWCGNRLGKSLIRPTGTYFTFSEELKNSLLDILEKYEKKFVAMSHLTYRKPSIQNRFDYVGGISTELAKRNGNVGLSARVSNVCRDIRVTHPYMGYKKYPIETILLERGDVFARFLLKRKEIKKSIAWIRELLKNQTFSNENQNKPNYGLELKSNSFSIALTEGWRGEICHCAITDSNGEISHYKIKDPSMHNWKSLELSLRNVEISDFPINNKSYNLSYCGHDL